MNARLTSLFAAIILLVAFAAAAPAEAQETTWTLTQESINHTSRDVTIGISTAGRSCSQAGSDHFIKWGDGSADQRITDIFDKSHKYARWGTFEIQLHYKCQHMSVKKIAKLSITLNTPAAGLYLDVRSGGIRKVTFTPTVVVPSGKTFQSISWLFSLLQTTPTAKNDTNAFTHTYTFCGTYTISATATYSDHSVDSLTRTVKAPCDGGAAFSLAAEYNPRAGDTNRGSPVKVTPTVNVGSSGKVLWSIQYDFGDGNNSPTIGNTNPQRHFYAGCNETVIIRATLTLSSSATVPENPLTAHAQLSYTVPCRLELTWAEGFPSVLTLTGGNKVVRFQVKSSKAGASAICYETDSEPDQSINCPPGNTVQVPVPTGYTCGPINVKAQGTLGSETSKVLLGTTPSNCPLNPTLEVNYDYTNGQLTINASNGREGASMKCKINEGSGFGDEFPCGDATIISKPAGRTYTVSLRVFHGTDEEVKTVTLIVPAQTSTPAATTTAVPLGLTPPSGLAVTTSNGNGFATWNAAAGATGYDVKLQVGHGGTTVTLNLVGLTRVDFTLHKGATNCCVKGEQYRVQIRGTKGSDATAWSDWVVFVYTGQSKQGLSLVPLAVTLSLSYDYGAGNLMVDLAANKSGSISCAMNEVAFTCHRGRNPYAKSASAEYKVTASMSFGGVSKTASVTLVVPASPGPAVTASPSPPTATPSPQPFSVGLTGVSYNPESNRV
ncbi:MAG: hypothetical protein OXG53_02200, partial [Chloroflexi bacterium]|nr:hypothetical protein [Chloroflexota bacterium]